MLHKERLSVNDIRGWRWKYRGAIQTSKLFERKILESKAQVIAAKILEDRLADGLFPEDLKNTVKRELRLVPNRIRCKAERELYQWRFEARAFHLARSYLQGRTYKSIEPVAYNADCWLHKRVAGYVEALRDHLKHKRKYALVVNLGKYPAPGVVADSETVLAVLAWMSVEKS